MYLVGWPKFHWVAQSNNATFDSLLALLGELVPQGILGNQITPSDVERRSFLVSSDGSC